MLQIGYLLHPVGQEVDHFVARKLLAVDRVLPGRAVVELGGGSVECDPDLFARFVTGLIDCLEDDIECFLVALQVGCESPFVADRGVVAFAGKDFLEVVKDFGSGTQARR